MSSESERPELWAFWEYDQFPGYLGARVEAFEGDNQELVRVKGYSHRFHYFAILPGELGRRMHVIGETLRAHMRSEERRIRDDVQTAALALFKQHGLTPPPSSSRWCISGDSMDEVDLESQAYRIGERLEARLNEKSD